MTVIRSVSDAVEPSSKYSSMRRCNGFLRRPEILETVYSVEEDGDSENNQDPSESTENSECEERRAKNLGNGKGRLQDLYGSFERLAQEADSPPNERPRDESQQAQVRKSFCPNIHLVATVFRLFAYALYAPLSNLFRRFASEQRLGTYEHTRIFFPFENPLRFVYLSFFTIFAAFSESFEIKRSCNRVHRTLDSFS